MEMFVLPKRGGLSLNEYINDCYIEALKQGYNPYSDNFYSFNRRMQEEVGGTVYAINVPGSSLKIPSDDGSSAVTRCHHILEVDQIVYDPGYRECGMPELEYLTKVREINNEVLIRWAYGGNKEK